MRKEHKSKKGGLTKAGRAYFKRTEGANLKAPVRKGKNPRRVSFAARFAGMKGPMKDSKGRPTRKALALKRWGFGSVAAARKFAAKNKKSQEDKIMPGHYGKGMKKKGKGKLTKKQKTLPPSLKKAIMAKKKKKQEDV